MTTQRWGKRLSALAFSLVLTTAADARAQWGFASSSSDSSVSPFGHEYVTGSGWGNTPYDYGSFGRSSSGGYGTNSYAYDSSGGLSSGGYGGIDTFPNGSNILSTGLALTSHESVSNVMILGQGTSRSPHRLQRRSQTQHTIRRPAFRR